MESNRLLPVTDKNETNLEKSILQDFWFPESDKPKLYSVTMERTLVVVASSQEDAEKVARRCEREDAEDLDGEPTYVSRICNVDDIPDGWNGCIPYEGDGNTRIEDYLKD